LTLRRTELAWSRRRKQREKDRIAPHAM